MKNLVVALAVLAFMVGCNTKTLSKKDVVGNYNANVTIDSALLAGQDPAQIEQVRAFMAAAKFSYNFKEDGTGSNKVEYQGMSDEKNLTWEMVGSDTIKVSREGEAAQLLHIAKTEKGFKLDAGKGATVTLVKK